MRILICGGRDLDRYEVFKWLSDNLKSCLSKASGISEQSIQIDEVVHGGYYGGDQGAGDYGNSINARVTVCKANWSKYGKAAGPIRNKLMLDKYPPDWVVALPGGDGTKNMVQQSMDAGFKTVEVSWNGDVDLKVNQLRLGL